MRKFLLNIPPNLWARLLSYAEKAGLPRSVVIRRALAGYLKEKEKENEREPTRQDP